MHIVILDGIVANPGDMSWAEFEALGALTVYDRTPFADGDAEIIRRARGAEAVVTNKTPLSASTLAALAPALRYVGVLATGYNVVDAAAARAQGVTVTNIPAYSTNAVAQFTMALLLELCHHVGDHNRSVKRGDWTRCPDFSYWNTPLIELSGKTLGVIGYGRIGRAVASLAAAFGMNVLAYTPSGRGGGAARMATLDEVLEQSDVISLHCPLSPETKGLINQNTIAKMKDGAFLLNTARGGVIVEEDLAAALASGKVAGAAVDVLSSEPPRADNPLLAQENCIITPHIAWAPAQARRRLMRIAAANLRAFVNGTPQNTV